MKLEGIHHITAITENGQKNVDFYVGVLGLRLVKKTVNQDQPTVYHLFFADEEGSAGSDLTFFEFPGAPEGRAGAGMVHRIVWRVGSRRGDRLLGAAAGRPRDRERAARATGSRFADPEGLGHELAVVDTTDAPLIAEHPEIPRELALQGFDSVRAYSAEPEASRWLLEWRCGSSLQATAGRRRGDQRGGVYIYDEPPARSSACRVRAPSITSPGPRDRRARGLARAGDRGRSRARRR